MTRCEILSRYTSSLFGGAWFFLSPLIMLTAITFVFSSALQVKWNNTSSHIDFAFFVFSGLLFYNFFAESIARASELIASNVSYVKKIVFPVEVLAIVAIIHGVFRMIINISLLIGAMFLCGELTGYTCIYLPIIILPFILMTLGIVWIIAAASVFFRDISHIIPMFNMLLLFLSPIFYDISHVQSFQFLFYMNPLSIVISQCRAVIFAGNSPDFFLLAINGVVGICCAWIGLLVFIRAKKAFADVL